MKKTESHIRLLEDEIEDTNEWWQNKSIVEEMDKRYTNWQKDKEKGYTTAETKAHILQLKVAKTKK